MNPLRVELGIHENFNITSIFITSIQHCLFGATGGPRDCGPDFWCMWLFWLCWLSSGNHIRSSTLRGHCDGMREKTLSSRRTGEQMHHGLDLPALAPRLLASRRFVFP